MASKTDDNGNAIIGVKEHIKNLYDIKVEQTDLNNINNNITKIKNDININNNEIKSLQNDINNKQDILTSDNAGDNIFIDNNPNTGKVRINFSGNIPNAGVTPEQLEQAKLDLKSYTNDKAQDAVDDFIENTYNDKIDELNNNITNNSNLINNNNQSISTLKSEYDELKSQVDFIDVEINAISLDLDNNSNDIKKLKNDTDTQFNDINNKILELQKNDIMKGYNNFKQIECTAGVVNKPKDLDFSKAFEFKLGINNTLSGQVYTYTPNKFIQGVWGSSDYDLTYFYNNGNPIIDSNGIIISRMAYTDLGNNNPTNALSSIATKSNFSYKFYYWQNN